MFKVGEGTRLSRDAQTAEANYVIQPNDYLELEVYGHHGERLIDPERELAKSTSANVAVDKKTTQYLVDSRGMVKLPQVDELKLEGLTIRQAEAVIQKAYEAAYPGSFALLRFVNKRVIVLGAAAGGKVIPLVNENVRLAEVLALAGGIGLDGKAQNIRVLRKDQVFLADFSSIQGYLDNNLIIQPGDIVYVEPNRRPFFEGLRDYASFVSILVSITTVYLIYTRN